MISVCPHTPLFPFPLQPRHTNDIPPTARSLDENLHTRQGPARTFLILARYAARTVFEEQMEVVRQYGNVLWPRNLFRLLHAWASFMRVELKLEVYEKWLSFRSHVGLSASYGSGSGGLA